MDPRIRIRILLKIAWVRNTVLKGLDHTVNIYLKAYSNKTVFCVHAQIVFKYIFSLLCSREKLVNSFCVHLLIHFQIQKKIMKAALVFCYGFPSLLLVDFLHGRLSEQFSRAKADFKVTFKATCGNRKAPW
jgi:hypothetical protein